MIAAGVFVAIPLMFLGTPSELAPTEDQGLILVSATGPATATLHYLDKYSTEIRRIFDSFPQTKQVFQINGLALGGGGGNNAMIAGMKLHDWSKRKVSQMQLLPRVQAKLNDLTGVQAAGFEKPSLPGSPTGFPVQFVLTSSGRYRNIDHVADAFIAQAMQSGKFAFLTKDLRYDNPQVLVTIDRALAGELGITMAALGTNLAPLLSGNYVNRFNLNGRSYKVIPQVPDRFRAEPAQLRDYYVRDAAGQSRQYVEQGNTFLVTFALSILLVYLLLAAQFESFRDPLIVMVTVPMAISGALAFLYLGAATLNIYTEVGLVTLIGLITKQGILIVQFANVIQETEGLDRTAAVIKASSIRLRPILMTTGAMVFGAVPLILAVGPGSVSRFDMGLVIASGLAIGALFSLYVVPAIYTYLAADKSAPQPAPAPQAAH